MMKQQQAQQDQQLKNEQCDVRKVCVYPVLYYPLLTGQTAQTRKISAKLHPEWLVNV
jgi:hypothetical protein